LSAFSFRRTGDADSAGTRLKCCSSLWAPPLTSFRVARALRGMQRPMVARGWHFLEYIIRTCRCERSLPTVDGATLRISSFANATTSALVISEHLLFAMLIVRGTCAFV